jgi:hypothetical protein
MQLVNLPEAGNQPQAFSITSKRTCQAQIDNTLQQMHVMLEDCGYMADQAEAVHQRAQEATDKALGEANQAHTLSVGMKKLLAELQRSLKRSHSRPPSDRSQTRLELVMVPPMASEDKRLTPSQIGDGHRLIEPSAALGQTQEGALSKVLQCDLDIACQHLGLLYEANADLTAISEAVAQAREAHMILEHHKHLDWAGFNGVQPLCERSDQGSDHNHLLGTSNAPGQSVHTHALLLALLVNLVTPGQALLPLTPHQVLQFDEATQPTPV